MDYASCHVVYVDKRAYKDRYEELSGSNPQGPSTYVPGPAGDFDLEIKDVQSNLRNILNIFNGGKWRSHFDRSSVSLRPREELKVNSF